MLFSAPNYFSTVQAPPPPFIVADKTADKAPLYSDARPNDVRPLVTRATPGGRDLTVDDLATMADWELAVICLPRTFEYWDDDTLTLYELRDVVGCGYDGLQRIARRLFPRWDGRYKFQFPHICRLMRAHLKDAKVRHPRKELLRRATLVLKGEDIQGDEA